MRLCVWAVVVDTALALSDGQTPERRDAGLPTLLGLCAVVVLACTLSRLGRTKGFRFALT